MLATPLLCLSLAIHMESRSEIYNGQLAVASVVMNRVAKNNSDVCTELNKKGQFPWTKDKFRKAHQTYYIKNIPIDDKSWSSSILLANQILTGSLPVIPKLIAFDSKPHPEWKLSKPYVIGHHYFYSDVRSK